MILMLLVGSVLQTILPGYQFLGEAKFPLLFGVVLYFALSRDTGVMLVTALLAGLLQDALTPIVPLGYSSSLFCLMGLVVGRFRDLVLVESLLTASFFGVVASAVMTVGMYMILASNMGMVLSAKRLVLRTAGTALLGGASAPLIFFLATRLDRVVGNIEVRESIDHVE